MIVSDNFRVAVGVVGVVVLVGGGLALDGGAFVYHSDDVGDACFGSCFYVV